MECVDALVCDPLELHDALGSQLLLDDPETRA